MRNKELNTKYGVLIRVNRRKAKRLYEAGEQLYLIPCNANSDSMWVDFNCNNEFGNYTSFYVRSE